MVARQVGDTPEWEVVDGEGCRWFLRRRDVSLEGAPLDRAVWQIRGFDHLGNELGAALTSEIDVIMARLPVDVAVAFRPVIEPTSRLLGPST